MLADAHPDDDTCVPQLDVPAVCSARWGTALGADEYGLFVTRLDVASDGSSYLLLDAPSGARLVVGDQAHGWGGAKMLVALSPAGVPRWARDRQGEWLHDEHRGRVITSRISPTLAVEWVSAVDGALLREMAYPNSVRWIGAAQGDCAAGCIAREVRVAQWTGEIDLGPRNRSGPGLRPRLWRATHAA